jgi:hypothetical protein
VFLRLKLLTASCVRTYAIDVDGVLFPGISMNIVENYNKYNESAWS